LALGIPMATVRHVTAAKARGDDAEAARVVRTSATLSFGMGLLCLVLGFFVYFATKKHLLGSAEWTLTPAELEDASRSLLIMLAFVASNFTLRLPYALFDAHHDFVVRNAIYGIGLLARVVLTIVLLEMDASLTMIALATMLVPVIEFAVASTVSRKRHAPLRFVVGRLDWRLAQKLLAVGLFAFLINMGSLLAFRREAIVIGAMLDNVDVADYGLGNKVFEQFIQFIVTIGAVAMPMATQLEAEGRREGVRALFLKWSKIATTLVFLVGGFLILVGPQFLSLWFGSQYAERQGEVLPILTFSFFFFLPVHGVAMPILTGINKPKIPGIGLLIMGAFNVAISIVLAKSYGIHGVAIGTALPNIVFAIALTVLTCRQLGVRVGDYASYVLPRCILGLVPGLAFLAFMRFIVLDQVGSGFPLLAFVLVSGTGYVAIFAILQYVYVYRDDPHMDLRSLVQRALPKRT
ncbi:MAG TPA: polysaccharide biosynthesis C-terminal domain-containing protein, partial [Planctomycetota bacterium]|nr:polysaccharide biosynthesis C-terminal domain-containing protein [Planctomycetota bacterium]